MLAKISFQFFAEKRFEKIFKLCKILFFSGIILAIAFPLLSERMHVEEKQLRHSGINAKDIPKDFFYEKRRNYFDTEKYRIDETEYFCNQIFFDSANKPYNHVYTKEIKSPRGTKLQFIQINLIYDKSLKTRQIMFKANSIFYTIMYYYSRQENIKWLGKDLQFNYISKELYYEHPKECYEILTSGKYNKKILKGHTMSASFSFDLSEFDIDNIGQFVLKFHGMNTELVDMDFYQIVSENLQSFLKSPEYITTHDKILSLNSIKSINSVTEQLGEMLKKFINKNIYKSNMLYLIEEILNNYFMINNRINTNHLMVTNNYNSILIKIKSSKNPNQKYIPEIYYNLVSGIQLMIKAMSNEECDLFRGQYFYLLVSPYSFIGYKYLFLIIVLILRIFYELVHYIYNNEYKYVSFRLNFSDKKNHDKSIRGGKIVSCLFFYSIFFVFLMLHIEDFMSFYKIGDLVMPYYYIIGISFIVQLLLLFFLGLNQFEEKFISTIFMYLLALNCWNFVFINVGIGLIMSLIILSMEFLFLNLKKTKKNIFKIVIVSLILYSILSSRKLIISMLDNYLNFNNQIYIIITITVAILTFRIAIFMITLINKIKRGESWNYDSSPENEKEIDEQNQNIDEKDKNIKA